MLPGDGTSDTPEEGAFLHCFEEFPEDKRDAWSTFTYLCVHDHCKSVFSLKRKQRPRSSCGRKLRDPHVHVFPKGQLRDCAVFSRVLGAEEVQRMYEEEVCGSSAAALNS